jgi:hypothetical protein
MSDLDDKSVKERSKVITKNFKVVAAWEGRWIKPLYLVRIRNR